MGMRPNLHFDRCRWKYIVTSFREQTGQALTKPQLKNKWDVCKKDWRLWNKLIGETGVGWSNELGTIAASNEWWKSRIQVNFFLTNNFKYVIMFYEDNDKNTIS